MTSAAARDRNPVQTLEVRLGETRVGALTHLGNEALIFTFDPTYIEASSDRPTLSLSFKAAAGDLAEQTRPTRVRLPPFFSNLLPEGHLREYLAVRGGIHPDREFFLIWLLGADLPGAIEIRSPDGATPPAGDETLPADQRQDQAFRFSLAGVQLKFSALMETSKGLTLPVGGVGGDWIVKLPSPRFEAVPENEYAMMTLAKAVGIDVPEVRLVATKDIGRLPQDLPEAFGQSLAVRRFDRPRADERVHIEDFAQVFGVYPENKYRRASYGSIARVLWLEAGEDAITEYTRRLVFNVLIGNADAHLKNWSLIYPDRRTPQLAPAYDLVGTVPYIPADRLALSLGDTKEFADVDLDRFRRFAEKAGLPVRLVVQTARQTAERVRDLWPAHEPLRALPDWIREAVAAHLTSVPL
ncbi:MAG: HipA domain-containing protein [Acidobacteria bacterium]|nr:HipA domain-containing protein [Acidobacteriota bacterium]